MEQAFGYALQNHTLMDRSPKIQWGFRPTRTPRTKHVLHMEQSFGYALQNGLPKIQLVLGPSRTSKTKPLLHMEQAFGSRSPP
jgi:hypothetical protein